MAYGSRREELDDDLSDYISARKRKKINFKKIFSFSAEMKPYKEEKLEMTVQAVENSAAAAKLEKEYEFEKAGWFGGFLASIGLKKKESPKEEFPAEDPMFDDMRSLAKISMMVMRNLPQPVLADFKETPEFAKFKEILKKHNLIR
jgi:hypothetical protein